MALLDRVKAMPVPLPVDICHRMHAAYYSRNPGKSGGDTVTGGNRGDPERRVRIVGAHEDTDTRGRRQ